MALIQNSTSAFEARGARQIRIVSQITGGRRKASKYGHGNVHAKKGFKNPSESRRRNTRELDHRGEGKNLHHSC